MGRGEPGTLPVRLSRVECQDQAGTIHGSTESPVPWEAPRAATNDDTGHPRSPVQSRSPRLEGSSHRRGSCLVSCSAVAALKSAIRFEQGVTCFHRAVGPTDRGACSALDQGPCEDHSVRSEASADETPGKHECSSLLSSTSPCTRQHESVAAELNPNFPQHTSWHPCQGQGIWWKALQSPWGWASLLPL